MTTNPDHREEVCSIAEQAAAWHVALGTTDPKRVPEFWQWVTRSPVHVREALVLGLLQQELQNFDPEGRIDLEDPAACETDDTSKLNPLTNSLGKIAPGRWLAAAIAIAACISLGLAADFFIRSLNIRLTSQTYVTGTGEQRYLTLNDGSTVVLDAQSRLEVQLSRHERYFHLEGQALFDVARDPARPFRVRTAVTTVEAVGTEFNVRTQGRTTVAVLDGVVRLSSQAADARFARSESGPSLIRTQLGAGEAADINGNGEITGRKKVDRATVTAWEQRRLVFSGTPLADIAREFNRYNPKGQLRVEGKATGLRFGGVFDASDPGPLLLVLRKNPAVSLERQGDDLVIRDKR